MKRARKNGPQARTKAAAAKEKGRLLDLISRGAGVCVTRSRAAVKLAAVELVREGKAVWDGPGTNVLVRPAPMRGDIP